MIRIPRAGPQQPLLQTAARSGMICPFQAVAPLHVTLADT